MSFGKTTSGFGGTKTWGAAKNQGPIEIPSEIKGKTVKQILDLFDEQLENQITIFQTQARQIARWDRLIFDTIDILIEMEKEIKIADNFQKDLARDAKKLLTEQEELIKKISETETGEQTTVDQSLDQRKKLYDLAFELQKKFIDLWDGLEKIKVQTDKIPIMDDDSDAAIMSKIASSHLDTLQWIDQTAISLNDKIKSFRQRIPE